MQNCLWPLRIVCLTSVHYFIKFVNDTVTPAGTFMKCYFYFFSLCSFNNLVLSNLFVVVVSGQSWNILHH